MKLFNTLRFRLSTLYLLTIMIPTVIIIFTMPSYYQRIISNETKVLTENTLEALSRDIDTYLSDLDRLTATPYYDQKFMNALKFRASSQYNNADSITKYKANQDIDYTMSYYLQNTRTDILSSILVLDDGTSYSTNKISSFSGVKPNYNFFEQSWYKKATKNDGQVAFISAHPEDYFSITSASQVFSVARIIKDPDTQKRLAFIMADADYVILEKIFNNVNFNISSIVSLFDDNGNLIYSNHTISPQIKSQIINKKSTVSDGNQSYTVVSNTIENSKWNIIVLLSSSELKTKFMWVYEVGIMFAIGELVFALSLFIIFSRIITDPFRRMTLVMKEVENGNLKAQLPLKGKDEVSQLGIALNNMIVRLKDLIDREYHAVLSKRNAEYYALQSQIQPHFLYNTLNGFIGLNRLGERDALEKAILSLKGMLRYTLEHNDLATISEEFLFIQKYCELQKIRFQDRLKVKIGCDESIAQYKIPKLLVQPLVENAIIHGIEPLEHDGLVSIYAGLKENGSHTFVEISIIDTGVGFDINNINESVGISNVRDRLTLFNNSNFNLTSIVGLGTKVIIEIPKEDM